MRRGDRVESCSERPGRTVGWVGLLAGLVTEIAIVTLSLAAVFAIASGRTVIAVMHVFTPHLFPQARQRRRRRTHGFAVVKKHSSQGNLRKYSC